MGWIQGSGLDLDKPADRAAWNPGIGSGFTSVDPDKAGWLACFLVGADLAGSLALR